MGYLVKASYNAEPRSYALAGIQADVGAGLLPLTAMVRDERQDFWYSVGELIGERTSSTHEMRCAQCRLMNTVRAIDVGLLQKCGHCRADFVVFDPESDQLQIESQKVFFRAKLKIYAGVIVLVVAACLSWSFYSGKLYLEDAFGNADQDEVLRKKNPEAVSYSYWGGVIRYVLPGFFAGAFLIQNGWSQLHLMRLKLANRDISTRT